MRVAGIDCGTNSIRLLIADIDGDRLMDVERRMEVVRLGEGVDRTGRLSAAALDRTFAACRRYAAAIREAGAERVRFVATSASRDASNAEAFIRGVEGILGTTPEVIPGTVEAELSYVGATRSLRDLPRPTLVVDIGGGSTEFVLGAEHAEQSVSVDIGCVRLTERHEGGDVLSEEDLRAMRRDVDDHIDRAGREVDLTAAQCLVGLAGTVTTMAAIALRLPAYDPDRIHGSVIAAPDVHDVAARLAGMRRDERLAMPVMHPGRADVIPAGAMILDRIVHACRIDEVVVSEHDILDGIAWSLVD